MAKLTPVKTITDNVQDSIYDQIQDMKNCDMNEKDIRRIIKRDVSQYLDFYFKE